jgi:DMSO reductase anchor subunit
VKPKYTTVIYFLFIFLGGGFLLFREEINGQAQLMLTVIAVCVMMFGLYKTTSSLTSNKQARYKDQEYYNREKYEQQEAINNEEE